MTNGRPLAAAVLLLCSFSCRSTPSPAKVHPAAAGSAPDLAPKISHAPKSQDELATTSGDIAASNFASLLAAAAASDAAHPKDAPPQAYSALLQIHAQFFGAVDDYARALAATERTVRHAPNAPEAYLARASARQALHLFDDALVDLDKAFELHGDRTAIDAAHASIDQARGRLDDALTLREASMKRRATADSMAALANVLGEMGRLREADALYLRAQDAYTDASPFFLAWLYFQQGLLAERNGMEASARAFYEEAHTRLPIYAPVAGHLAALVAARGDRKRALALLDAVCASSPDPEYHAQRGTLLVEAGRTDEGKAEIELARRRYTELVRAQPAAFADHAARFWIGPGGDVALGRKLAAANISARRSRDAFLLVLDGAEAAHDDAAACEAATNALTLPYPTPMLHLRAGKAFARCGQKERADAELAASAR